MIVWWENRKQYIHTQAVFLLIYPSNFDFNWVNNIRSSRADGRHTTPPKEMSLMGDSGVGPPPETP